MLSAVALPFRRVVSHGYLLYIHLFLPGRKVLYRLQVASTTCMHGVADPGNSVIEVKTYRDVPGTLVSSSSASKTRLNDAINEDYKFARTSFALVSLVHRARRNK